MRLSLTAVFSEWAVTFTQRIITQSDQGIHKHGLSTSYCLVLPLPQLRVRVNRLKYLDGFTRLSAFTQCSERGPPN